MMVPLRQKVEVLKLDEELVAEVEEAFYSRLRVLLVSFVLQA